MRRVPCVTKTELCKLLLACKQYSTFQNQSQQGFVNRTEIARQPSTCRFATFPNLLSTGSHNQLCGYSILRLEASYA